jgi:hypothetical protein
MKKDRFCSNLETSKIIKDLKIFKYPSSFFWWDDGKITISTDGCPLNQESVAAYTLEQLLEELPYYKLEDGDLNYDNSYPEIIKKSRKGNLATHAALLLIRLEEDRMI